MSKQTANKVPRIRFKGFETEWEEKTLGDLGSFKNGMNFGKEAMGHGSPFVNLQNVFGQFEVDDKKLELAVSSSVQRREYNLLKGDVLFIRSSVKPEGVGETALITKTLMDTTYSGFIIRYRPEVMMSDDFNRIAYRTTVVRKQILANASRSANTNINQNALKKIALRIPSFEEQTQIGRYFRELDRLIGLHQRKHGKLVALKKAMLQKMFPQPGTTTPEIRFKGFSGDWVEKKLGELTPLRGGFAFQSSQFCEVGIPIIKISNVLPDGTIGGVFAFYGEQEKDINYSLPNNAALLAMSGATTGKVSILKKQHGLEKFYQNQRVGYFQDLGISDYSFISTLVRSHFFAEKLDSVLVAGAQPNVSSKEIDNFDFQIPKHKTEQKKIGTYFRTLDSLISKHAIQLEKLQQIKSACLKKMFV